MEGVDSNIKGFRTLWLQYDEEHSAGHQLFFKAHNVRHQKAEYPKGQTLFVLNIPPYATEDALKEAFSRHCGAVKSVTFTTPTGFKTAYIVFQKESGLNKALSLPPTTVIFLKTQATDCPIGFIKWCQEYNASIRDEAELQEEIEQFMKAYDEKVAAKKAGEVEAEAGADGWVTVTGRKKRGQFAAPRKESTIKMIMDRQEQKSKKKQLLNFYSFQIRETKKQNLAALRKKFELDKKKLQELKVRRTFKPL